jgi:hypothetical protein
MKEQKQGGNAYQNNKNGKSVKPGKRFYQVENYAASPMVIYKRISRAGIGIKIASGDTKIVDE